MEKKYFIVVDGSPQGPFTPDELKKHGLKADSRIYVKGWPEFRNAADVTELAPYLTTAAPKVVSEPPYAKPEPHTAADTAAAGTTADISEKEMLMQIMKHLNELQSENRELRRELENLRHSDGSVNTSVTPPPPIPDVEPMENAADTPPPPPPPSAMKSEQQTNEATTEEWDKEWKSAQSNSTNKKSNNGGVITLIVFLSIAFIALIVISAKLGCSRSSSQVADSETTGTEAWEEVAPEVMEEVVAPAEDVPAAAAEAPAGESMPAAEVEEPAESYNGYPPDYYDY